jgi:non-specific serine/threonine protein kinase
VTDPLVGRTLGGKYRVDALVGRGAVGAVYRATQIALDRPVAVKVLRRELVAEPTAVERLRREALAVARLAHTNIVTIHHFDEEPDVGAYIVMEFLEGETLRATLERRGRLEWAPAIRLMAEICSAVQAAHDAGLLHRDLKPDNIFLVDRGDGPSAKVVDFGIAKLWEITETVDRLTATGHVLGSPNYMSPEQCLGAETGAASDVYGLGCVLYEMLAGRPPFDGADAVAVMQAHVSQEPTPLAALTEPPIGVPDAVQKAVMRALAKSPELRFASAEELGRTLRLASDVSSTTAVTVAPRERARKAPSGATLPRYLTSFVGREREVAAIASAIASARILTPAGPGGIGKSRLAAEVATRLAQRFDRTTVAELAALADPRLVGKTVAAALGAPETPGRPPESSAASAIGSSGVLLVLDNCEHLVEACAEIATALLRACPGLHVVATSREALGIAGETIWPVAPLALPPPAAGPAEVARSEAVRLFCDRAGRSSATFTLGPANAGIVGAICRRLDGIPLAIELAAARVKVLSVHQILERLEDRFRLLTGGDRSSFPRQHTLRAAVTWSYDLLTEEERALLMRLSVFAGGWRLDDAEGIVGSDEGDGGSIRRSQVLDLLARLVDKSLVNVSQLDAEPRYHLLETIRVYGAEKLREAGEEPTLRARHAEWYATMAAGAKRSYAGPMLESWLGRLDAEQDNVRQALATLLPGRETAVDALRLCCSVGWYWNIRGRLAEGRAWFARALEASTDAPDEVRAEALHEAANLAERQGDLAEARGLYERSLALRRALGDLRGVALTLHTLGITASDAGDYERAAELHEEAMAGFRQVGDEHGVAIALNGVAVAERYMGRLDSAYERTVECLRMCRSFGAERGVGIVLYNLGTIALARGDLAEAERRLGEGLAIGRRLGERALEANALDSLATTARSRGALARAADLCAEGLEIRRGIGDAVGIASSLAGLAHVAFDRGDAERALRLGTAALALRASIGAGSGDFDVTALRDILERSRSVLGPTGEVAIADGRAMSTDRAIAYGFETVGRAPENSPT